MHRATLAALCSLIATAALPGWSLAQNPVFAPEPTWTGYAAGLGGGHIRIALADIDHDGDLDLVSSAGLHWNTGAPSYFVDDERWNFPATGFQGPGPLALGDVNKDGFVDVLTMTSFKPQLVLNRGSALDPDPIWEARDNAHGAALADLDGDGDLDLICGGDLGSHVIYENEGTETAYAAVPVWSSETWSNTPRVAVGDLDLDGDLDLVFGNNAFTDLVWPNHLFLNNGSGDLATMFPGTPDWEFGLDRTLDMALGDVDGDGDLDLFVVNTEEASLHLNRHDEGAQWRESVFDTTAAWTRPIPQPQLDVFFCLELGDVDRNGTLDLVLGTTSPGLVSAPLVDLLLLNEGAPPFFATPAIPLPSTGRNTTDIDLADVDGDGDLDLITATQPIQITGPGVISQVFLNISPPLSTAADEPMAFPGSTRALAAGDVDRDGGQDLVVANMGTSFLYRSNPDGDPYLPPVGVPITLGATPRALALADFDRDGYPDLAYGDFGQANSVFLNNAGRFAGFPVWQSAPMSRTTSLAAGDIDGDGNPDLICGNANAPNRIYRNIGGSSLLERDPAWEGPSDEITQAVALADLDADGDLDAVFGNQEQANTVHLNASSGMAAQPVWSSRDGWRTTSVAIGDVDGDGYPDLVFGNDGQPNTLYLNSLGALAGGLNIIPWYSAESDSTTSVALVDLNGDGDIDLVCGNAGTGTAVYINTDGIFPSQASFRTERALDTRAVALADFDGDGDIDLVCGNDGQVNTVHLGQAQTLLPRDFTQPTHHRPNNPSLLSGLRVVDAGANRYDITVTAADVESDPVGLAARFRFRDSPHWQPVEFGALAPSLTTSPTGETHHFQWDVSRLAFDRRDVVLQVSTIPDPQTVHEIHHTSAAQFTVGPLAILRSQLVTEPILTFDRVTVGDTVAAPLVITNSGNAELEVTAVGLPSDEMRLGRGAPFLLAPGATVVDTVFLEPQETFAVTGDLTVASNDPLTPLSAVTVEATIDSLTVQTKPLLEGDTAPLGDALTIQVIPDENVRVERSALHYRRATDAGTYTDIEMTRSGRSFIGVVPGHDVAEGGLQYFIELENSGVFATDPRDTSGGQLHAVTVEDPSAISASARPSSGTEYLAGRAIRVDVVLPSGAEASAGHLRYRLGGQDDYGSSPLTPDPPYLYGTIPDSLAGARGLEYWVEVQTRTQTLTDPATTPDLSPHRIPVTVPDLAEADLHPGSQFRMVSVPLQFKDDFTGTLEALLFDQPEFGSYDPLRWRSFRWLPGEARYAELSEEDQAAAFRPEPGRAFWLVCRQDSRITTAPITATSTPTDAPWSHELQPGWNQVGTPFAFPVAWDSVRVAGGEPRDQAVEPPVAFVAGVGYQDSVPALEPWQGYWVKNITDPPRTVVLEIPAREATAGKAVLPLDGWRVAIRASAGGAVDRSTRLGCAITAVAGWDPSDRSDPPLSPGRGLSVYFPHEEWSRRPGRYTADIREPLTERTGHRWCFDVAKSFRDDAGSTVLLEFAGLAGVPEGLEVSLLDRELGRTQDLREAPTYAFHLGIKEPVAAEAEARFAILIGHADYVDGQLDELTTPPLSTTLHQNYPNPFNPETVIRWDVAQPGLVDLKIYDLAGALVRTVHTGFADAGGYEFAWRGEDDRGRRVASGVYIYRLTTPDNAHTRRMTLLK